MRKPIIGSAALHGTVFAATMISWPHSFDIPDHVVPNIPVELVSIEDVTNIAPMVHKPEPAPPLEEAETTAPEPEPEAEEASEPEPRPLEPERSAEETPPPKPVVPRSKPKPEQKKDFDFDSVLALLDKRQAQSAPPANARPAENTQQGIGAQDAMAMDLRDALLAQMRECWNAPVGAPDPENLIVQVRVFLARDGSLARTPELLPQSRNAAASDPYMRAASEAALRAVNICEPYRYLPAERYNTWREIVMIFDPSKMVGR